MSVRQVRRGARFCVLFGAAALGACASPERSSPPGMTHQDAAAVRTVTKTVRVYVPKPVRCVPDGLGPPPVYPDTDAALRKAGGAADRYQLLAAGRILREERLRQLEDVVTRCRKAAR